MNVLLSVICTIDNVNDYTSLFKSNIKQYKQFIRINVKYYDLHDKEELIENIEVIEDIVAFTAHYARGLTLEEIYSLSNHIIRNTNENANENKHAITYMWYSITRNSESYKNYSNRKSYYNYDSALALHDDLKSFLNKP